MHNATAVRRTLLEALKAKQDPEKVATLIVEALQALEAEDVEDLAFIQTPATQERRNFGLADYRIAKGRKGEVLLETRPKQDHPFRVPYESYSNIAKTLMDAGTEHRLYRDLLHLVKSIPPGFPDYQVRVCLRFWAQRGIVQRAGRWYCIPSPAVLPDAAAKCWQELRHTLD